MKLSKTPTTRAGIFVSIAFALLVIALFLIGDKEKLFSSTSKYFVKFKEINGLKEGAQVFISGINVGSVRDIRLPRFPGDSVFIEIRIVKDAEKLIRQDSKAEVMTEGLVGNKAITINIGSTSLPSLAAGDTLVGTAPFDISSLVGNLSATLGDAHILMKELYTVVGDVRSGKGTLGQLIYNDRLVKDLYSAINQADKTLSELSHAAISVTGSVVLFADTAKTMASKISGIAENIVHGKGSIAKLINDDSLYRDIASLSGMLRSLITEFKDASAKVSRSAGNAVEITEALKHNFLVKDYFEQRGYWDAEDFEKRIEQQLDSLRRLEKTIQERAKR